MEKDSKMALNITKPMGPWKVTVYDQENFQGKRLEFTSACQSIMECGVDNIRSLKVECGAWAGYEHSSFCGQQFVLERGEYPHWESWSGSNAYHVERMMSFRPVFSANHKESKVVLFQKENFMGAQWEISDDYPSLQAMGWANNEIGSMQVQSGATRTVAPSAEEPGETYDRYYNYDALTERLQSLARKYPHIANLSSVGRSVEGRQLWVMRITKDPPADGGDAPGKPKFKYVGNMHGDETVSRQVLVYVLEYLLTGYGAEPRATELVDTTDVYIMPSMNPDGFEKSVEGDCAGGHAGRNNAKDKDLNRSFPDQYSTSSEEPESIPEVMAVIRWIREKKFVLSGNLHGGTVVSSYPFDDSAIHLGKGRYSPAEDDGLFRYLALVYARNHPGMKTGEPNCPDAPSETFTDGITNGAQWYDVTGMRSTECPF
ncbi:Beta-crystallin A3 [Liparis tanakae]|uniref:Beta-crystallin A3 n=1 Tax=Liparis tanakae TaxID=230148 RepID=A0A4Z2G788_9TELE|nr:Beta-crystallin A3 [Liparis tanakae]